MKHTIIFLLLSSLLAFSNPLNNNEKEAFAEYYRKLADLRKEFPNKLAIKVIFFDLNHDGKIEALATSQGNFYEDGWLWSVFTRSENGEWKPMSGINETTGEKTSIASIFARPTEFRQLTTFGQKPSLLLIRSHFDKSSSSGKTKEKKIYYSITFNQNVLSPVKIPIPGKGDGVSIEKIETETIEE